MPVPSDSLAIETHLFGAGADVPNNPDLPLIVYRSALPAGSGAAAFEAMFTRNGWGRSWRNGIFPYHHYHPNAHEVLGIAAGSAHVRLGGDAGATVELKAGDIVVIPAGVAHKRESASGDLLVIGAYPPGQDPGVRRAGRMTPAEAARDVSGVTLPETDPVSGGRGRLLDYWNRPAGR